MSTLNDEATRGPISAHCIRRWPHADQAPGILGQHIANVIEAVYGASALALVLQNDQHIRNEREEADNPDENLAPFDENTRAGLFSALHACLHAINEAADRVYHMTRKGMRNTPRH